MEALPTSTRQGSNGRLLPLTISLAIGFAIVAIVAVVALAKSSENQAEVQRLSMELQLNREQMARFIEDASSSTSRLAQRQPAKAKAKSTGEIPSSLENEVRCIHEISPHHFADALQMQPLASLDPREIQELQVPLVQEEPQVLLALLALPLASQDPLVQLVLQETLEPRDPPELPEQMAVMELQELLESWDPLVQQVLQESLEPRVLPELTELQE